MTALLKKSASLVLVFSSVAIAAGAISVADVNKKIAAITAPYNKPNSSMKIEFSALKMDAARALNFAFNIQMAKKNENNQVAFKVNEASYSYSNGAPRIKADVSLSLDIIKGFGQETVNQIGGALEDLAKDVIAEHGQKYGEALKLDVKMIEMKKDAGNNVISAKLSLNASLDYKKLPADIKLSDVEFKNVQAVLSANRNGVAAKLLVDVNPSYKGFQKDEDGLKEIIEKLLNEDQKTYDELSKVAGILDGLATFLIEQKAE